jgi:hypothetical protein
MTEDEMTAYENFQYDEDGAVTAVSPALPQEVWADKVFEFMDVLNKELLEFANTDPEDWDLGDGSTYVEGHKEATEHLREEFLRIFDVKGTIR